MTEKDKGIKKALQQQPTYRLSSNFTYRMMLRIEEEARLKEKRMELRMRIALILTVIAAIGCIGWLYGKTMLNALRTSTSHLLGHISLDFYLPIAGALVLLFFFNRWLRKKYGYLLT